MIIQAEYVIAQESSHEYNRAEIIRAAEQAVIAKFPDFKAEGKKPVLRDMGDHWEFTYELPPTMLGGAPVVIIDKGQRTSAVYTGLNSGRARKLHERRRGHLPPSY